MRAPLRGALALLGCTGCIWLSDADLKARVDPDGDGVEGDADCAPEDPQIGLPGTTYLDRDGDGFGDPATQRADCEAPGSLWVSDATDCDDADAAIHPGAAEICDGIDDDCDGETHPCTGALDDAEVRLTGRSGSYAGSSLSISPDLTGDGLADLVVSAWHDDLNGANAGAVYVVAGPLSAGTSALASVAYTTLLGEGDDVALGARVSAVGDFNGDGDGDLAIGAHLYDSSKGGTYLQLGPIDPGLRSLPDEHTHRWRGERAVDRAGWSVALTELDGDGFADLVIGAWGYDLREADDGDDRETAGRVYFVPGTDAIAPGETTLSADALVALDGPKAGYQLGEQLTVVGDLDGDGQADLALSSQQNDEAGASAGAVYLLFGMPQASGTLPDDTTRLLGRAAAYEAGSGVDRAGDVNGDGHEDLWVGEYNADDSGADQGSATLMLGPFQADVGAISLLDGVARVYGTSTGDQVGTKIAGGTDVDGDGNPDVLIGALKIHSAVGEVGGAWLGYGPFEGTLPFGGSGATWLGTYDGSQAGRPLLITSSLSADGALLLLIGAESHGLGGPHAGAVFGVLP